jgi:methyltransferase-like protein
MSQTIESNAGDDLSSHPRTFPSTHIGRLAAIGRIFSLQTQDPTKARVLQLGCGHGVNLLAMAQLFPSTEFIGVDSCEKSSVFAKQALESTGLSNVKFLDEDILKIPADLGKFDYILAHEIYSMVPENVRDAILHISSANLNRNGIVLISYNCLPGWSIRGALRDMMLMHTARIPNASEKIAQSKELIKFLAESSSEETAYGKYLRQELVVFSNSPDSYLAQNFLAAKNDAFYFQDFLKSAAKHKLVYLGDSVPSTMIVDNLPKRAAEQLKSLNIDLITKEQYMDFVRNRMFRSTLLCHSDSEINRNIDPLKILDFQLTSLVEQKSAYTTSEPAIFGRQDGTEFIVSDALIASILELVSGTCSVPRDVKAIIQDCIPTLERNQSVEDKRPLPLIICQILLQGYFRDMLDFSTSNCALACSSHDKPKALPLARWQASNGHLLSTKSLYMIQPDQFITKLVTLCDGSRDQSEIVSSLVQSIQKNEFVLNENNQPITDSDRIILVIDGLYDRALHNLSRFGILIPLAK